jgi:ankyrin repeat protein
VNRDPYLKGTPLSHAAAQDALEVMEMLIRAGANLETDIQGQGTPLIAACSLGRLAAVKCLVRAGANLFGTKGGRPYSALHAAIEFPGIVRWLLVQQYTNQAMIES